MFSTIKTYIIGIALVIALAGGGYGYYEHKAYLNKQAEYSVEVNNRKAVEAETKVWEDRYGQEHARTIQFKQSLDDFKTSKDSVTLALIQLAKVNKINIKSLQQVSSGTYKIDTTILRHVKAIAGDTTIDFSDKDMVNTFNYKNGVASSHVALIDTESTFWSTHKETIEARKKFFLWRLFQKKQTVVQVDVIHTNHMIKPLKSKFILLNKDKAELGKQ